MKMKLKNGVWYLSTPNGLYSGTLDFCIRVASLFTARRIYK